MSKSIPTPNRWGHLTLLADSRHPIMRRDPNGNEYVADTHGPIVMNFRCDCGREFSIEKSQWPGRRLVKDCGENCPLRKPPKPKRAHGQQGTSFSIYMPNEHLAQVTALAAVLQISISAAVQTAVAGYFKTHPLESLATSPGGPPAAPERKE